jgi:hypothetical protein
MLSLGIALVQQPEATLVLQDGSYLATISIPYFTTNMKAQLTILTTTLSNKWPLFLTMLSAFFMPIYGLMFLIEVCYLR